LWSLHVFPLSVKLKLCYWPSWWNLRGPSPTGDTHVYPCLCIIMMCTYICTLQYSNGCVHLTRTPYSSKKINCLPQSFQAEWVRTIPEHWYRDRFCYITSLWDYPFLNVYTHIHIHTHTHLYGTSESFSQSLVFLEAWSAFL
jgi:hypothetical protein